MRKTNNNSVTTSAIAVLTSNTSLTSPTKEALHNELQMKAAASRLELEKDDYENVIPSNMKAQTPPGNLNDVCFGCEGGCSDAMCGSRRAATLAIQASAGMGGVGTVGSGVSSRSGSCSSSSGCNPASSRSSQSSRHGDSLTNRLSYSSSRLASSHNKLNNITTTATTTNTTDTNENDGDTEENGNSQSDSALPSHAVDSTDIICAHVTHISSSGQGPRTTKRLHSVESCDEKPPVHQAKLTQQISLCMPEYASTAAAARPTMLTERRSSESCPRTHRVSTENTSIFNIVYIVYTYP